MATKIISTTFQFRRGLAQTFATKNPLLACGEPAYEKDTHNFKIGDGVQRYNDLPYINGGGGANIHGDNITIEVNNNIITFKGFQDADALSGLRKDENGNIEWVHLLSSEEVVAEVQQVLDIVDTKQDKLIAGNNISIDDDNTINAEQLLKEELIAEYSIGGIEAGTTYAPGVPVENILRDLLTRNIPLGNKIYTLISKEIPTDVYNMNEQEVTRTELLSNGYIWKNIVADEEYIFLAIDKDLGLDCCAIIQSGFELGFVKIDLGDQYLYYPDTAITDTNTRLTYNFEEV